MGSLRDCNEKFTLAATMLYEYDIYTRTIYMVHTVGQLGTVQYLFSYEYGYSFPGITYFACILTVALATI